MLLVFQRFVDFLGNFDNFCQICADFFGVAQLQKVAVPRLLTIELARSKADCLMGASPSAKRF